MSTMRSGRSQLKVIGFDRRPEPEPLYEMWIEANGVRSVIRIFHAEDARRCSRCQVCEFRIGQRGLAGCVSTPEREATR